MQTQKVKRAVKRLLIRTVKRPLVASARLVHFVMTLEDDERVKERKEFTSTAEYLVYWHRRIVDQINREIGPVTFQEVPRHGLTTPGACSMLRSWHARWASRAFPQSSSASLAGMASWCSNRSRRKSVRRLA